MKGLFQYVLISLICSVHGADKLSQKDFRQSNWGESKAQVKKNEKTTFSKEGDSSLEYWDKVVSQDCLVTYTFLKGRLVNAQYLCEIEAPNYKDVFTACMVYEFLLYKKYGDAKVSEPKWMAGGYDEDDEADKGKALAHGDYVRRSEYGNSRTRIIYEANGKNGTVAVRMDYTQRSAKADIEKDVMEKELSKF